MREPGLLLVHTMIERKVYCYNGTAAHMNFDDELMMNKMLAASKSDWKDSSVPRVVLDHDCITM